MKIFLKKILVLISFGALLVSVSEFWFYEVEAEVNHYAILLAYGLLGYLLLACIQHYNIHKFSGFFVAACLLGILIEGVPVPVVYSGPPFSIVWTSLAWHALITVFLFWVLYKRVMAEKSWYVGITYNLGLGVALGFWNAYMWNAVEKEGTEELTFIWQANIMPFVEQFILGYLLFVGGHFVFERLTQQKLVISKIEVIVISFIAVVCALLVSFASGLWFFFPVLPALVFLCLKALKAQNEAINDKSPNFLMTLNKPLIPWWKYSFSLLIPISTILTYHLVVQYELEIEMNALLIVVAGPISTYLFVSALIKCFRTKSSTVA